MAKRFSKATKKVSADFGLVTFTFANGQVLEVDLSKLANETRAQAAAHGVSQAVGDSYAGAEGANEAFETASKKVEGLYKGEWSSRAPGEGPSRSTMLVEALYEVSKADGKTMADCEALIAEMSDDEKEGLRSLAPIKAAVENIRAKRAAEKAQKANAAAAGQTVDWSQFGGANG